MNCCFTGHRMLYQTSRLKQQLQITLEQLIQQGVINFYAGGALGWDTLCACSVISLRKVYPQIRLHLVLPCSVSDQTQGWRADDIMVYHEIMIAADSVEYTSASYWKGCMKKRNARLIAYADCCVCYFSTNRLHSGTGQTVRMAKEKGIPVINLFQ